MNERDTQLQLVTFQISEEFYGIDIMDVKEIVRVQDIRSIPNAPVYVEGLFNLRGEIIPIISLHKRFHLKKAVLGEEEDLLSGFIIIDRFGPARHRRGVMAESGSPASRLTTSPSPASP